MPLLAGKHLSLACVRDSGRSGRFFRFGSGEGAFRCRAPVDGIPRFRFTISVLFAAEHV
jgi:hypothetical protein